MEFEHEYTDEVVCPWCGCEYGDCWEWAEYSDEMKCDECGKEFSYEKDVTVKYSTSKKDCGEGRHEYVFYSEFLKYHEYEKAVEAEEDWEFIEIQKCSICDDKIYTKTIPKEDWIKKYPKKWELYQDWIKRDRLKYGECDANCASSKEAGK
ncbi:hypothetical protein KAS08_02440 [Candidatus Pacearchaeota archaeon]|nr:hypothetical protein [Candidatus Pacearchaeota archaeon]